MPSILRGRAPGRRVLIAILGLAAVLLPLCSAQALRVVTYNIVQYSGGRVSELQTIFNALDADIIVVQEIADFSAAISLLNTVLNGAGGPGGYSIATFTEEAFLSNNALFYRGSRVSFGGAIDHMDIGTSPRDTDRWRLTLAGYSGPAAQVYVYGMHLKAGSSSADQTERFGAALAIRNNANSLPDGSHLLLAGDFNIQSSSEDCYEQAFTGSQADNSGRAFDPIASPGNWSSNPAFAAIHTQSPHQDNAGAQPGAAGGGMDDRFDFQLVSTALLDGDGLDYVAGSYRAFGNDGDHYNDDINDPPTIPEGILMANALHTASDHLPVVADYQVPALITLAPAALTFPPVILGATASATLHVGNGANLALFDFADELDYSFGTPPEISGPAGSFSTVAGVPASPHLFQLSSASAGTFGGSITVSSNAASGPGSVPYAGTVLRHAVPSLDGAVFESSGAIDFGSAQAGGFGSGSVTVHNLGHDVLQAPLDVHQAEIIGADATRFSIVGGFSPLLVTGSPVSVEVEFDAAGGPGSYSAVLILSTRDDPSLPGASGQASLIVDLTATVLDGGCPDPFVRGEMNGDSMVDIGDGVYLLTFLFGSGPSPQPLAAGNTNGDGTIDIGDAVYLLGYLFSSGPPPPAPFPDPGCP